MLRRGRGVEWFLPGAQGEALSNRANDFAAVFFFGRLLTGRISLRDGFSLVGLRRLILLLVGGCLVVVVFLMSDCLPYSQGKGGKNKEKLIFRREEEMEGDSPSATIASLDK